MFRLSTTLALLSSANAFDMDETSLMQGLKPAQELTQRHDKKKAITNLLSTATSMLKNGATPDVVNFATATLQEITGIVVPAVQDASNTDQDLIVQMFSYFEAALVELEQGTSETKTLYDEERLHSSNHKACRGREETACGHKQNCDYELYELWTTFSEQESIMRQLSTGVSSHFCAPDANGTLQIFREHSVSIFPPWIEQKPIVEHWEHLYDLKVPQCEEYFVDLDEETAQCDAYQTELEDSACQHAVKQHEVRSQFNVAWETATENYAQSVADVLALEADRWNEYKTLKTVECLLQATTAYNGRPCDETTVNSVQTDCESSRPQCTRIEHGDMRVGHPDIAQRLAQWRVHGFATIESPDETCDMCKVNQDGDIDASIVRDNSDTLASYQGLCIWYPTPPQQPDPCDAPYGLHDGRCDPNPPNAPCSALFHAQEYQELWMPPMPEFNSDNSHCNPRKECQACLGLPAPSPAPAWVNPILIAGPAPAPVPAPVPVPVQEGGSEYIGCFVDDSERDMGDMLGSSYTFATCRVACGAHTFMSLQYGGECFCANEYGTGPAYVQVEDENCNVDREPCSSNSHNCGGTWHQAIYQIHGAILPTGWSNLNENWNCGGTASSDHEASHAVTTNVACAEACYDDGYPVAAFWHDGRNICRCYESCEGGGPTVMPAYPNIVMQKVYHLAGTDQKCPHQHEERLFRSPESGSSDITLAGCHIECRNTVSCAHFSFGEHDGGNVCMGCTTLDSAQTHAGFNTYDMERSIPVVQMLDNWDFEGMTTNGVADTLLSGKWIHFRNNGNSGLTNPAVLGWQQMGEGAGASGLYHPPSNEIAEGSHVLFLNSGDDSNYVYQTMTAAFTADMTIRIEAGVGGGNGGSDGGYRMGLYSEDGTLVQEVAAGVNGAPDTSGSQYITTYLTVAAADHTDVVGQHLQLRLMKNKGAQGHYHYIRFT